MSDSGAYKTGRWLRYWWDQRFSRTPVALSEIVTAVEFLTECLLNDHPGSILEDEPSIWYDTANAQLVVRVECRTLDKFAASSDDDVGKEG